MMSVEIRLSSAVAPMVAEPAADLLRAAANTEPERRNPGHDDEASKGDPVAIAALILSIPSAILAAMDLVERARVAERVRDLLKKVREVDGTSTLHVGAEPSLDLRTATEDEVMNLLAMSRRP
jgi:hypothetical protein